VLLLLALAVSGCGPEPAEPVAEEAAVPRRPLRGPFAGAPVVVISIDTLRSDRLPLYGYDGVETPALASLAADGVVFERAYSAVPLTLPSHATLLTGLLPPEHGVRDNSGFRLDSGAHPYLPLELQWAGYRTGAAVSSFVLRGDTGLAAGFEHYEDALARDPGQSERPGAETVRRALAWLAEVRGESFFLLVHLFEPHSPYDPPEPWRSRYGDPYDGEVAAADAAVGQVLEALRRWGLYDRSLVIALADHGEGLGDHGEQEHGLLLYREALQVPLVIKLPGGQRRGEREPAPVSLVDVAPTLRTLLGLTPEGPVPLLEASRGERGLYAETYFPQLHLGWSGLTSWIEGPWHLIRGPRPELYDLMADPGESTDLVTYRRSEYHRLAAALEARERPPGAPAGEDDETRRRLAALGYVGGGGGGPGLDPKAGLAVFEAIRDGVRALAEKRFDEAIRQLEAVVAERPDIPVAWEHLGLALQGAGRLDEAAEAFERALRTSDGAPRIALGAARVYTQLRRWDEARSRAALALAAEPVEAHGLLAEIALGRGDQTAAAAEAGAALALRAAPEPRLVLAQVALTQGDAAAALEQLDAARVAQERLPGTTPVLGLHTLEGEALARLGRMAEAEAALRREVELFPEASRAYSLLASVYGFQGRGAEARTVVEQMVAADPRAETFALGVSTLRAVRQPEAAAQLLARGRARFPGDPRFSGPPP
jgi:arylsulfatase A-like enzyme/Flp pilus assembly protein TadD